ncbi:MAG TPA: NADH-quinone oxidoreductase subunit H, partial [Thermoanaerobaculia bacterium]|nr:NADH-quinone oxidoreductase subunit H [Thermoanaerobaculia bacterium]
MQFELLATAAKMALMLGIFILGVAPIMLWVERRMSAFMQDRPGPNRLGPLGLVQGVADAVKFMFKEDVTPAGADKPLYLMAPALALIPALSTYVVIPFGPDLTVSGKTVPLIVSTGGAGVLIFLALSSLGVYSLITAGYASNNKFSLLGGIRASAQLISYELALTVAVLAALIPAGSFYLPDVVAYQQQHLWMVIPQA